MVISSHFCHAYVTFPFPFDLNVELERRLPFMSVPPMLITIPLDIQIKICAAFLHPSDILALRNVCHPLTLLFFHFKVNFRLVNIFNLLQKNV